MNSYEIKSFNGGISDYEDKGIRGAFKFAKNADIRKKVDSLSCQQALVEEPATNTFNGLALWIIPANDGNTYFFCKGGRIIKRDSGGTYTLCYTETNESGDILGAAEWYDNTGKTYLFWATATRLNRKEIPGASNWSDVNATGSYPKTNLTSAAWHTMREVNGSLNICNANTMALVGYDGSYTNNSLQLIPGNLTKAIFERNRYAVIGCTRADSLEQSGLFAWDAVSLSWNDKKILPARSINALIDASVPLAQIGSDGAIYYADLYNDLRVTAFPGGGQVNPAGVANDDGLALFGVYGNGAGKTGVYSYGRKEKNAPFCLNLEYQLDCDEIGAVCNIGSAILVSYKVGSTYGVKKVSSTTKAQAVYESLDLKAPPGFQNFPNWKAIELTTAPLPSGTNIEVWYRYNKSGNFVQSNMDGNVLQFTTADATNAVFYLGDIGRFFEYKIILNPSGNLTPEVYKAEVFFE